MKAVRFHEYGESDVLRYEDAEQPVPGAGQVLVRVAATSFNPVDSGIRGGYLREAIPVALPHTPGIDVAGTVEAVGPQVSGHQPGERVIAFLPMDADGAAAEFVVAPADVLASLPDGVPLADAAALPIGALTAWQALLEAIDLKAGQRLLINGAAGAVGGYAVQLARRAGAYVIGTARPDDLEQLRELGADQAIDYHEPDPGALIEQPLDAVLNLARITPERLDALASLLRDGGALANTVPAAGAVDRPGVRMVPFFVRSDAAQLTALAALVDRGELKLGVAERLPLRELPSVHARSDGGELSGKVLLLAA